VTIKQDRAAKKRERLKLDKAWADAVKRSDEHRCQKCGSERALNAAHIFGKKAHPSVRHDMANGITLCWPCHRWWAHQEPIEFAEFVLKRLGKRRYEALRKRANSTAKDL
jgi:5-methylcytosine-specific restriction endonuclease McrA